MLYASIHTCTCSCMHSLMHAYISNTAEFSCIVYGEYEEETNSSRCHVFFVLFFPGNKLKSEQYLTRTYNLSFGKWFMSLLLLNLYVYACMMYNIVYVVCMDTYRRYTYTLCMGIGHMVAVHLNV